MYHIGIDIGSTYTKISVLDDEGKIKELCSFQTPICQKVYFEDLVVGFNEKYSDIRIISCGYGKKT